MSQIISLRGMETRDGPPTVVALHCSGATGRQWRPLAEALGQAFAVAAPGLIGTETAGPWNGERAFALADEAAPVLDMMDARHGPVHLVGHSYGGAVALYAAAQRPALVASLTLYEPSAFHLLRELSTDGRTALDEITGVAGDVEWGLVTGDYRGAAERFVDYWSGRGAWAGLRPEIQAEIKRYVPKAALDFRALIEEPTPLSAYCAVTCPALVLRGSEAPLPTRLIACVLAESLKAATSRIVGGAGHMGPLTHSGVVAQIMAAHIRTAEARRKRLAAA